VSAGFAPPWQPYCGAEFHGKVAGHTVICDLDTGHGNRHFNEATGFEWWGHAHYPRTGGT
jgi:hypothetical protein